MTKAKVQEAPYNPERYVPYRILWIKVIFRAAYDYALWKNSPDLKLRKIAQDAAKWLFEPSALELGFENICFQYSFPLEQFRIFAKKLTREDVKKLEFRERTGKEPLPGELVKLLMEKSTDGDGE